jgi:hypothetical protein
VSEFSGVVVRSVVYFAIENNAAAAAGAYRNVRHIAYALSDTPALFRKRAKVAVFIKPDGEAEVPRKSFGYRKIPETHERRVNNNAPVPVNRPGTSHAYAYNPAVRRESCFLQQ